jgi:hypothetical protein
MEENIMSEERYVVVTSVSQFRVRHAIPMSRLQEMNPNMPVDPEWANDAVTMNEAKEFSQTHLGDTILDTFVLDEERVLQLFDRDNDYLSEWDKEKKLNYIDDWKEKPL